MDWMSLPKDRYEWFVVGGHGMDEFGWGKGQLVGCFKQCNVQDAATECDDVQIAVLMNYAECKKQKMVAY